MTKSKRGRYTLEFKQEAVRLVESGQSQARVCRSLGVVKQTLFNWVSEHGAGTLKGSSSKPPGECRTDGEQSSSSGVGACDDKSDILGKATAYFAKGQK